MPSSFSTCLGRGLPQSLPSFVHYLSKEALLEVTLAFVSIIMIQDEAPTYQPFLGQWKTWAIVAALLAYLTAAL